MALLYVKKDIVKKLIEKGTKKPKSNKSKKKDCKGFLNGPDDCCIISKCRHFLRATEKSDINLDLCNCKPEDKIPLSRISFFQSQLFDRGLDEIMKINDLPPIGKRLPLFKNC